jgi:hypothetical protein
MRKSLAAATAVIVVALAACSGTDTLSPAPSTNIQGGDGAHPGDTTVVSGPQTKPSPGPVVSSFALTGIVYGHEPGPDTTKVVGVADVSITLVKVADVNGDTLKPSIAVASTTTDGQGAFRLESLAPAYYRIDLVPPAGSPFVAATGGIGPARETEVKFFASLWPKS